MQHPRKITLAEAQARFRSERDLVEAGVSGRITATSQQGEMTQNDWATLLVPAEHQLCGIIRWGSGEIWLEPGNHKTGVLIEFTSSRKRRPKKPLAKAEIAETKAEGAVTATEAAVASAQTQAAEAELDAATRMREWQTTTGQTIQSLEERMNAFATADAAREQLAERLTTLEQSLVATTSDAVGTKGRKQGDTDRARAELLRMAARPSLPVSLAWSAERARTEARAIKDDPLLNISRTRLDEAWRLAKKILSES